MTKISPQEATDIDRKYQRALADARAILLANQKQLKDFRSHIDHLELRQVPVDIWGFLRAVTTDFERVDALDRTVAIVAGDEDEHGKSTYCDGCSNLRGARVVFMNFTHSSPDIDTRRRDEWQLWLRLVGASDVQFYRPGQPVDGVLTAGWK